MEMEWTAPVGLATGDVARREARKVDRHQQRYTTVSLGEGLMDFGRIARSFVRLGSDHAFISESQDENVQMERKENWDLFAVSMPKQNNSIMFAFIEDTFGWLYFCWCDFYPQTNSFKEDLIITL